MSPLCNCRVPRVFRYQCSRCSREDIADAVVVVLTIALSAVSVWAAAKAAAWWLP